jgi:hypothetical protein
VAIDPVTTTNWYVNNGPGVSIYLGTPPNGSTPGAFNAVLNKTTDVRRGSGWADHDLAGALFGGPVGQHEAADRDLPGVARAGQRRGLEFRRRHQPDF